MHKQSHSTPLTILSALIRATLLYLHFLQCACRSFVTVSHLRIFLSRTGHFAPPFQSVQHPTSTLLSPLLTPSTSSSPSLTFSILLLQLLFHLFSPFIIIAQGLRFVTHDAPSCTHAPHLLFYAELLLPETLMRSDRHSTVVHATAPLILVACHETDNFDRTRIFDFSQDLTTHLLTDVTRGRMSVQLHSERFAFHGQSHTSFFNPLCSALQLLHIIFRQLSQHSCGSRSEPTRLTSLCLRQNLEPWFESVASAAQPRKCSSK